MMVLSTNSSLLLTLFKKHFLKIIIIHINHKKVEGSFVIFLSAVKVPVTKTMLNTNLRWVYSLYWSRGSPMSLSLSLPRWETARALEDMLQTDGRERKR